MILKKLNNRLINRFLKLEELSYEEGINTLKTIIALIEYAEKNIKLVIKNWYKMFGKNDIVTGKDLFRELNKDELKKFRKILSQYIEECAKYDLEKRYVEELKSNMKCRSIVIFFMLKILIKHILYIAYVQIYNQLNSMVQNVYSNSFYRTIYEVQNYTGKYFNIDKISEKTLSNLVYVEWGINDKHSTTNRLKRLKNRQINDVISNIALYVEIGRQIDDVLFKISKIMKEYKNSLSRLTRTEQAFYNSLAQYRAYKLLDIEKYQIVAVIDERTSYICKGLNGKSFLTKDYEVSVTAPPFHPNCRSTTRPCIEEIKLSRENIPNSINYSTWKKKYIKEI